MERPILFSGPMVRAILEGRKTQTRRVIKLPRAPNHLGNWEPFWFGGKGCRDARGNEISGTWTISHTRTGAIVGCPYGQPGDRLWVRETFASWHGTEIFSGRPWPCTAYRAGRSWINGNCPDRAPGEVFWKAPDYKPDAVKWRPSIFMPRALSRILLEVTDVRVERVQDISEADALAEGCHPEYAEMCIRLGHPHDATPRFRIIWNAINERRGFGWDANPWTWAITFKRMTESAE